MGEFWFTLIYNNNSVFTKFIYLCSNIFLARFTFSKLYY